MKTTIKKTVQDEVKKLTNNFTKRVIDPDKLPGASSKDFNDDSNKYGYQNFRFYNYKRKCAIESLKNNNYIYTLGKYIDREYNYHPNKGLFVLNF